MDKRNLRKITKMEKSMGSSVYGMKMVSLNKFQDIPKKVKDLESQIEQLMTRWEQLEADLD